MKDMTGKVVPINPNEIRVSKGPSLIANIDSPPISERFPYALVNAAYIPLLLFVMAAIIAIVDNPNNPVHGSKIAPSSKPTANPEKYLVDVNKKPFFNAFPPIFKFIWLPTQKMKSAIKTNALSLNSSCENPPICNIS